MTAKEAFRQWCRLMREFERLYRRSEGCEPMITQIAGRMAEPWLAMGGREQFLAVELASRLRGGRPWRRMFP